MKMSRTARTQEPFRLFVCNMTTLAVLTKGSRPPPAGRAVNSFLSRGVLGDGRKPTGDRGLLGKGCIWNFYGRDFGSLSTGDLLYTLNFLADQFVLYECIPGPELHTTTDPGPGKDRT